MSKLPVCSGADASVPFARWGTKSIIRRAATSFCAIPPCAASRCPTTVNLPKALSGRSSARPVDQGRIQQPALNGCFRPDFRPCPNGATASSPGLPSPRGCPGNHVRTCSQPNGVTARLERMRRNPVRVGQRPRLFPRVASPTRQPLGWRTESRWDLRRATSRHRCDHSGSQPRVYGLHTQQYPF